MEDGRLHDEPWMSLDVAAVGEGGFLVVALDPKYAKNRYASFYFQAAEFLVN